MYKIIVVDSSKRIMSKHFILENVDRLLKVAYTQTWARFSIILGADILLNGVLLMRLIMEVHKDVDVFSFCILRAFGDGGITYSKEDNTFVLSSFG